MKKAVLFGAGKIGRGFIGRILCDSGYEICFLEILPELIDDINSRKKYTVKIISAYDDTAMEVGGIRAENSLSRKSADEIAACDLIATAVGARNLPDVAVTIAEGIKQRIVQSGAPVDVILAENQIGADTLMRGYIYRHLNVSEQAWADKNLGSVASVIGLMVPQLPEEESRRDRLLIAVEEYGEFPVDKAAFKAGIPNLKGLAPHTPFSYHIERKLYVHNMGHAVCAYMGYEAGYEYIHEAIKDPRIRETALNAMYEVAQALSTEYAMPSEEIEGYAQSLIVRFENPKLQDTLLRVGADPVRKLSKTDRLCGAAALCVKNGIMPKNIAKGIAAALKFAPDTDAYAQELQEALKTHGADFVIEKYMGLDTECEIAEFVKEGLY